MFGFLSKLFSSNHAADENEDNQLWLMVKEDEFFRDDAHLKMVDDLTELIEGSGLGELDGHSSGAYQFEINFYDVSNFEKVKAIVVKYMASNFDNLVFSVSKEYETFYEKA
ncbi:hypothetical protein AB4238_10800 [Shewanella sp. 10N.286.45.A1]|uniref:hypothetical protein n=1 Tax=Shewanella sp. 10N.286.45.A1 TaxID=3229694 RepID=UPI003551290B